MSYSNLFYESESCSLMSDSLWTHGRYSLWNSLGKNTGVGKCHSLLQGDFSEPGIEPRSPALQADPLPAEPLGKSSNFSQGNMKITHNSSNFVNTLMVKIASLLNDLL